METLNRNDLVMLHTLVGARLARLKAEGVCEGDDMLAQSNRRYAGNLRTLGAKLDTIIDAVIEAETQA